MSLTFKFYNHGNTNDANDSASPCIIYAERLGIGFLMNQIAYDIIEQCKKNSFSNDISSYVYGMADHGYQNHFIYMVNFLYSFVRDNRNNKWVKSLVVDTKLIAKALEEFKRVKDMERRKEIEEMGKNFGSATAYNQWDPCEYNEKWLSN